MRSHEICRLIPHPLNSSVSKFRGWTTGDVVWAHGGMPCGEWSDLRLARNAIIGAVLPREIIIADRG